ncbi:MAG: delta-60 repeat domain-containing protein [Candidatus Methanomethylicaceae archaeon]
MIARDFTALSFYAFSHIGRFMPNGLLDPSFNPGTGASSWISTLSLQSDGKILIGGQFRQYQNFFLNYLARLLP